MERVRSFEQEPVATAEKYLAEYEDTKTWLAEVLDGNMRSSFDFYWDGKDIYSQDGRKLREIFDNGIECAKEKAKQNPKLEFDVRRTMVEREECEDIFSMMRGELPNTMIVISEFPKELEGEDVDVGGYNVRRRQAMLRVITVNASNKITITSQSLDGSDTVALYEIYNKFALAPEDTEFLGQRIHIPLDYDEQHEELVDWLTDVYDTSLETQRGDTYHAGRRDDKVNTYDFVESQHAVIDTFLKAKQSQPEQEQELMQQTAALLTYIYEGRYNPVNINTHSFKEILSNMQGAGFAARTEGRTFSGCGLTLGEQSATGSTEGQLEKLGYSAAKTETMKCVTCPFCKKTVDAIVTKEKICCPKCNASAKR